ncbi:DUF4397 domain-containing protein [Clostridium sp. MSJ-11]|uniref:DUF4397 domain-containing protein n=1 Tax=Clostridium mobile TaxID=2841512 RepID=A0ABS6ECC5_9CLOT|nr:DUF4397 domain-containing protein [Clostridium mobile]MBU5482841.1 DUF4397 domain-containing protein [Clostridium mobile]
MFNCPYFTPNNFRSLEETSYIRIFHASPNAPAVDVYLNDRLVARNLKYRDFTEYLKVTPNNYNVKVYPTGNSTTPIINTSLSVGKNQILTAAAIGLLDNISIKVIEDPPVPIEQGSVMLRVAHLSPDAPRINASLANGNIKFDNVDYMEVTNYQKISPGLYTMEAEAADTGDLVLIVPNILLRSDKFYTIYIIGLASGTPSLQVVIPLDGNSYIKF